MCVQAALDEAAQNNAVRCVGRRHGRAVCAGQDLKEITSSILLGSKSLWKRPTTAASDASATWKNRGGRGEWRLRAQGPIALACDFVVAKSSVKFIKRLPTLD